MSHMFPLLSNVSEISNTAVRKNYSWILWYFSFLRDRHQIVVVLLVLRHVPHPKNVFACLTLSLSLVCLFPS